MAPSTRAKSRRTTPSTSSCSPLLELPDSIIIHIFSRVPAAGLCSISETCRLLHNEHVPAALPLRAALLGQRLCMRPDEPPLAALRFAELRAARIKSTISADTCHTMCVSDGGAVWAWGGHEQGPDNQQGEDDEEDDSDPPCWLSHLGLGMEVGPCVTRPARISSLPHSLRVLEVAAGYEHSLLRCDSGHVWSCGVGEHGRLGHGSLMSYSSPKRIEGLEHVSLIAAGGFQSLALTDEGIAYSWGWGESGSTGHGDRSHRHTPTVIEAFRGPPEVRIVQASAGSGHSLFVSEEGGLYACGDFRYGKLGLGQRTEDVLTPTRVTQLPKNSKVRQASAWHAHSLCVTAKGELYSFGCGERGRLGHGDERARWRPNLVKFFSRKRPVRFAAAGELHSCVQTLDGKIYAFGDASLGQTGSDPEDGWLLKPSLVDGLAQVPVNELAVGDHHTLARVTDPLTGEGAILAFGKNIEGQLGLGGSANTPGCIMFTSAPSRVRWPGEPDAIAEATDPGSAENWLMAHVGV